MRILQLERINERPQLPRCLPASIHSIVLCRMIQTRREFVDRELLRLSTNSEHGRIRRLKKHLGQENSKIETNLLLGDYSRRLLKQI